MSLCSAFASWCVVNGGWSDRALTSLLTQVREHLARGVGQAREDFVRGCIWGFVPHLPLHR